MSHFLKYHLVIGLLALMPLFIAGQYKTNYQLLADNAMKNELYQTAFDYYTLALTTDSNNIEIYFNRGLAAYYFFDYRAAESNFVRAFSMTNRSNIPSLSFWLGEVYRSLGDYTKAFAYYDIFLRSKPQNSYEVKKSQGILNAKKEILLALNPDPSFVVEHLKSPVNTPYSEFGALQLGEDSLLFSSVQPSFDPTMESYIPNSFASRLFFSQMLPGGQSRPMALSLLNAKRSGNVASPSIATNGQRLLFSFCPFQSKSKNCKIYWARIDSLGCFSKSTALPTFINTEGDVNTQAYLFLQDSLNGILFFSSNRKGGYGGMDLWYSAYAKGSFQEPSNLGSIINTEGNEITPFFDAQDSVLYFSSDFHPGMGAYDVFKSKGLYSAWAKPQLMPAPINSGANDFYFNINTIDRDGYLTSNREGSYFIKGQTCCNDIFSFIKKETIENYSDSIPVVIPQPEPMMESLLKPLFPLDLYFHNDIPDPRSRDSITSWRYDQCYFSYITMIDQYIKEYTKGVDPAEKARFAKDIEEFFNDNVTLGFDRLMQFTPLLIKDLESGSHVIITIKGFCSPLTSTEYNIQLAKRRIFSLLNYFFSINGGVLKSFYLGQHPSGGTLTIVREPIGEALTKPYVSDNPSDVRNSVFSISAAMERRIQIADYQSDFMGDKRLVKDKGILFLPRSEWHYTSGNKMADTIVVPFQNVGNGALRILDLHSSHDGILLELPKMEMASNEESFLKVIIPSALSKENPLLIVFIEDDNEESHVIYLFPQ